MWVRFVTAMVAEVLNIFENLIQLVGDFWNQTEITVNLHLRKNRLAVYACDFLCNFQRALLPNGNFCAFRVRLYTKAKNAEKFVTVCISGS